MNHISAAYTKATTSAAVTQTTEPDLIQLHAAAVNGLSAALRLLTSPNIETDSAAFNRALGRAMRATSALKRVCAMQKGAA